VAISDVAGAIALAINLSVPSYITGSIGGAFVHQMKKALTQLLREVKSDLVGWVVDTFIMIHHDVLPPRVSKLHEDMYAARKGIHLVEFAKMLDAPGGYLIVNYPNMHAFHSIITDVGLEAFGCLRFREFVVQLLLRIPEAAAASPSTTSHSSSWPSRRA